MVTIILLIILAAIWMLINIEKEKVMEQVYKEVYFDKYCKTCRYEKDDENDVSSPCYDCLAEPKNLYSHIPVMWKAKDAE